MPDLTQATLPAADDSDAETLPQFVYRPGLKAKPKSALGTLGKFLANASDGDAEMHASGAYDTLPKSSTETPAGSPIAGAPSAGGSPTNPEEMPSGAWDSLSKFLPSLYGPSQETAGRIEKLAGEEAGVKPPTAPELPELHGWRKWAALAGAALAGARATYNRYGPSPGLIGQQFMEGIRKQQWEPLETAYRNQLQQYQAEELGRQRQLAALGDIERAQLGEANARMNAMVEAIRYGKPVPVQGYDENGNPTEYMMYPDGHAVPVTIGAGPGAGVGAGAGAAGATGAGAANVLAPSPETSTAGRNAPAGTPGGPSVFHPIVKPVTATSGGIGYQYVPGKGWVAIGGGAASPQQLIQEITKKFPQYVAQNPPPENGSPSQIAAWAKKVNEVAQQDAMNAAVGRGLGFESMRPQPIMDPTGTHIVGWTYAGIPPQAAKSLGLQEVGGQYVALAPGATLDQVKQAVAAGGLGPKAPAQMLNMGFMAATVVPQAQRVIKEISDMATDLGPLAGRWNDVMAGRVGTTQDKGRVAALQTDLHLLSAAIVRTHFGSRGGAAQAPLTKALDNYFSLAQTPENLQQRIATADLWLGGYAEAAGIHMPEVGENAEQGIANATGGAGAGAGGGGGAAGLTSYQVKAPDGSVKTMQLAPNQVQFLQDATHKKAGWSLTPTSAKPPGQ